MAKLLYIEASPRKARSHSIAAAEEFLAAYQAHRPGDRIEKLDLWAERLPAFDGPMIDAKYAILAGARHTPEQAAAWAEVEAAIARFKSADRYLFSVPMWNFAVPYRLKHYVDIVTQPGLTFSFSPEQGYAGLVADRPAAVIYASGGDYAKGSGNPRPDLQKPFFETWLRFIGITDIRTIAVAPTLAPADRLAAIKHEARDAVLALSGWLAQERAA